ncbi:MULTISPECIES: hypothetical protein [unclassified Synechococcus]|uniref:hypothetical protein n=1 Tax=unclassified Synechococcus TaxID=2626047 RepID=UPI000C1A6B66|nr:MULTISPECIES: hypothetical protein [unclassified Synechococcus]PIK84804.1 hypothetical protein SYN65AY6A5_12550 [Synechococcus sp. 65AY6A5]
MRRRFGSALGRGGLSLWATCASVALITGCSSETTSGVPPLLASSGATPPPVAVAPTIAPNLTPITFRPGPDFAPITPPPIQPDLPDPPSLAGSFQIGLVRSAFVTITLTDLRAPGVIRSVEVQFFNISRGTDITSIFLPTAIEQFRNTLIGRNEITLTNGFTFPADPAAYNTNVAAGETVLVIVVIRDSFGQALRLEARAQAT